MKNRSALALVVVGIATTSGCLFNFLFPFAPDQLSETLLRAQCGFAFRCCTPVERDEASQSSARDEASCIAEGLEEGSGLTLLGQRAKAAIDAGKAEYDQELADECLKPIIDAANACDADTVLGGGGIDAKCNAGFARMFTKGKVKDGDDCTDSLECADEGVCDTSEAREEAAEDGEILVTIKGVCVAVPGEGDSCEDDFRCQSGLECDANDDGEFVCQEIELLENGEECDFGGDCESGNCKVTEVGECSDSGDSCSDDSDCDEENFEFCDIFESAECADPDKVEICDGL